MCRVFQQIPAAQPGNKVFYVIEALHKRDYENAITHEREYQNPVTRERHHTRTLLHKNAGKQRVFVLFSNFSVPVRKQGFLCYRGIPQTRHTTTLLFQPPSQEPRFSMISRRYINAITQERGYTRMRSPTNAITQKQRPNTRTRVHKPGQTKMVPTKKNANTAHNFPH